MFGVDGGKLSPFTERDRIEKQRISAYDIYVWVEYFRGRKEEIQS